MLTLHDCAGWLRTLLIAVTFVLLWVRFVGMSGDGPDVTTSAGQAVTGIFTGAVLTLIGKTAHTPIFFFARWCALTSSVAIMTVVSAVDTAVIFIADTIPYYDDVPHYSPSIWRLDYAILIIFVLTITTELSLLATDGTHATNLFRAHNNNDRMEPLNRWVISGADNTEEPDYGGSET